MNAVPVALTPSGHDPFAGPAIERACPTTEAQREVWLADQMSTEASLAYNESSIFHLEGELDAAALRSALQALGRRHEALRTVFSEDGLHMIVLADSLLPWQVTDLSGDPEDAREARAAALATAEVTTPFDLARGPLLRAHLLRLSPRRARLILSAHHLVCDGWSLGVLARDLARGYAALAQGLPLTLTAAPRYSNQAVREQADLASGALENEAAFWTARMTPLPLPLELPTDRARPAVRRVESLREDVWLDADLVQAVKRAGGRQGCSLFSVLLAGFAAVLGRVSGQDDVVVGVPAAGQMAAGEDDLVGHCVNLLPVRLAPQGATPLGHYLGDVHARLMDAFEHQRFTFGTLLQRLRIGRDPARLPLVNVMFNADQALDAGTLPFGGLRVQVENNPRRFENFELFVNATQVDGRIRLECQYATSLFDAATIRGWMDSLTTWLNDLVSGATDRPVGDLALVSPAQAAALAAWNATDRDFDRTARVHDLTRRQAARSPHAVAVRQGARTLTHGEIDQRSDTVAAALRARGVGRGDLVGLCLERTPEMLVAQLGVLKAGAGYVPLDPAFPADRLAYMAEDAGLALLLTQASLEGTVAWPAALTLRMDSDADWIAAQAPSALAADAQRDARPEDPAYVIYTSGSTGKPKGVVVPHGAVVNFLESMAHTPGLRAGDRLVAVTTLSFDIAVLELLLPLSTGAEIVLVAREDVVDAFRLREILEQTQANVMQATPTAWRMLVEAGWQGGPDFKALIGGEALSPELAQALTARTGALWNMYGPTETTVWSTCWRVVPDERGVSIGRPIDNTQIVVLDERLQPCPPGVPGEICIGGDGVTVGYLHRPELTEDRFRSLPGAGRVYRTGDRGRWRLDGLLEHLGRMDFQVKIRGYRIELGEIESRLGEHPDVGQCVVVARAFGEGDTRLVGYVARASGASPDEAGLRQHLRRHLPDYMVPTHLVVLDALPLLPNGKINRHALPAPAEGPVETAGAPAASPARELALDDWTRRVLETMRDVLGQPGLDPDAHFFESGGHSLMASRLLARLSVDAGRRLGLGLIFQHPTARRLAEASRAAPQAVPEGAVTAIPGGHRQRGVLSPAQVRLWFVEQLDPGTRVHNVPSGHRLLGPMDVAAFERAFAAFLRRQDALRASVVAADDATLMQVHPLPDAPLLVVEDLRDLPVEQRAARLAERLAGLRETALRADAPPLLRAALFRLADDEHLFFFMAHHIVWDGVSFDVMYEDLAELYAAESEGRPARLPALAFNYLDYATWQAERLAGAEGERQARFWSERMTPLPAPLALPLDLPRPERLGDQGDTVALTLGKAATDRLEAWARHEGTTTFAVVTGAIAALLHQLGGQEDLVIGTPVWGRDMPGLERLVGLFINVLPLRLSVRADMSLRALVAQVREVMTEGFANPDVPFDDVVRRLNPPRDASRTPVYQVLVSFQDVRNRPRHWGALTHERAVQRVRTSAQDVGFWCALTHDGLEIQFRFNTALFLRPTIEAWGRRLLDLLEDGPGLIDAPVGAGPASAPTAASPVEGSGVAASTATATDAPAGRDRGTDALATLQAIWAEVLGRNEVPTDRSFVELGGHSLLMMRLVQRIERSLGLRVPLRDIFDGLTLGQLASRLASPVTPSDDTPVLARVDAPTAPPRAAEAPAVTTSDLPAPPALAEAPLSPMQSRVWYVEQLNPGITTFHIHSITRLHGDLSVPALEQAVDALVARHPGLRTHLVEHGEDVMPRQVLADAPAWRLADPVAVTPERLNATLSALCDRPFRLLGAPLWRLDVLREADDRHLLLLTTHHLISDGTSMQILWRDLARLYAQACGQPVAPLPAPGGDHARFAAEQHEPARQADRARQLAWWVERLSPPPGPLALPTDRPRPASPSHAAHMIEFGPRAGVDTAVSALMRQAGTSRFIVALAAHALSMARCSGQDDLVIAFPVQGRDDPRWQETVGFFANTLPLRLRVRREDSFLDLVRQVRDGVLEAMEHPDVPVDELIRALNLPRDPSRQALYQTMFSYQELLLRREDFGNLRREPLRAPLSGIGEDLTVWMWHDEQGLRANISYATDLFDASSIQVIGNALLSTLEEAAQDAHAPLSRWLDVNPAQRPVPPAWNATDRAFDRTLTLPALFAQQAARTPQAPAVTCTLAGRLSHGELQAQARRLARALRERGAARGAMVGLSVDRGPGMIVAMQAVLLSGAAYVPLDPAYPVDRLQHMAEDAALTLLVCDAASRGRVPWPVERTLVIDEPDAEWLTRSADPLPADPQRDAGPQDPAYVIYTSGSTGKPKGVVVPHGAVVNLLASMAREPGLRAGDRWVAITTLSFDMAVPEVMLPLAVGAEMVLARREQAQDGDALRDLLDMTGANVLQATPSTWRMLLEAGWQGGPSFKALIGAEPLPPDLARTLCARVGELWNLYGPTETTVWSTCWRVDPQRAAISVGAPMDNTQVHVLDERQRPLGVGESGEIWIGGDGVTLGYLNRPELSEDRFRTDPFRPGVPGARMYRTGDRGRWCVDGLLEHQGRLDFQVKVRGHRIELGEIENAIAALPEVSRVVVTVREDVPGDQRIVAYVVGRGDAGAPDTASLRRQLRRLLPDYMLPQHAVTLSAIPLLPNGKVNRHALPVPSPEAVTSADAGNGTAADKASAAGTVAHIARIWQELLGVSGITAEDNFFDLGGHSLLAMRAVHRIAQELGRTLTLRQLIFEDLGQIAARLDASPAQEPVAVPDTEVRQEPVLAGGALQAGASRNPGWQWLQRLVGRAGPGAR